MKVLLVLVPLFFVMVVGGCVSSYTLEQGMSELESIEGRYLDGAGNVMGSINNLVGELESFKARIDSQSGDDIRALSIFTDFKISYYNFINELESLTHTSQQASCSTPDAIDDLVDSAGSVRYYSERISDNINQLITGYRIYIGSDTISGMERLRDDVTNTTNLLMETVDERISMLMNCSGSGD